MWFNSDMPRPTKPKQTISSKKVMIAVFWSSYGIHSVTMLPPKESINAKFFDEVVLEDLKVNLLSNSNKKNLKGYFLHIDNLRPHLTKWKMNEIGIERI